MKAIAYAIVLGSVLIMASVQRLDQSRLLGTWEHIGVFGIVVYLGVRTFQCLDKGE